MGASLHQDLRLLRLASKVALRGHGSVEPNPMVGCVVTDSSGAITGIGHHERFGAAHAEINALTRAGASARNGTLYATLEPCNHHGKTPACTEAIVAAGMRSVVFGQVDPNPTAHGGANRLREAGIEVEHVSSRETTDLIAPFVHRIRTGLPWVIAKWAQTVDGRIATRTGESRWISNESSRRLVHRERGRVDAILTAVGTVLADDPLLTARGVPARRTARRVVIDAQIETPLRSAIVRTAHHTPTTIVCLQAAIDGGGRRVDEMRAAGVELLGAPAVGDDLPLAPVLRDLVRRYDVTNVLVEAGPGLLGRLFAQRLVNAAWVFVAPTLLGDEHALPCVRGMQVDELAAGTAMRLAHIRRRGGDVILHYRVLGAAD